MSDEQLRQRMDALHRANETRSQRAQLKRDIKAGQVSAVDIINDPPTIAQTMRVAAVLEAVPGIGPQRISRTLERLHIHPLTELRSLSNRQRAALAELAARSVRLTVHVQPLEQVQKALTYANTVRVKRGRLHVEITTLPPKDRAERVAALLVDPPAFITAMRIMDLLTWCHRIGPGRAVRFMQAARVPLTRTVGMTTERQRRALADCVMGDAERVESEANAREWATRVAA